MSADALGVEDWHLSDEELLTRLQRRRPTKTLIRDCYLGRLPELIGYVQTSMTLEQLGLRNRREADHRIRAAITSRKPKDLLTYTFSDRGTFAKQLRLLDPRDRSEWTHGEQSRSTVFYVFGRSKVPSMAAERFELPQRLVESLGIIESTVMRVSTAAQLKEAPDAQRTLPF